MPIKTTDESHRILEFLKSKQVGVLATADKQGKPHAAAVFYSVDDELDLYFVTKDQTKKFQNIQANSEVAFVVYDEKTQTTVQLTGAVEQITDESKVQEILAKTLVASYTTSGSAITPPGRLIAGNNAVFCIHAEHARLATYIRPQNQMYQRVFDTVPMTDEVDATIE